MLSIGRYQLSDMLGQGGMGVVYRAYDTQLQRVVAVKLINGPIDHTPELRERFFREARAAGQLSHKNIVIIHDLGEHEGHPFLAMEYLEGEDLQQRLRGPVPMTIHRKVELAIELCEGLEYAHAHGVVHRDIKPANIFITSAGQLKILDFGLARLLTSQMTQSNMLMGTVNYMAPEQVRGERADHRSDVFSAGVVLYELLGGRKAFEGDSFASTLYKILQELPEPLWKIDATLPPRLVAGVDRALAKALDERYQSMGALRQDLQTCLWQLNAGEAAPALTAREPDNRWRPDSHAGARPASSSSPLPGALLPGSQRTGPLTPPSTPRALAELPASSTRARRAMLVAASAVIVLMAVAAATWWRSRDATSGAPQPAPPATAAAQPAADTSRQELARAQQALEAHDYAHAETLAHQVLTHSPENAEARRIRDGARTAAASLETGLRRARASYASGDYQAASRAAGEVLGLAPSNAEAKQIMVQGAARSLGASAVDARTRMLGARSDARAADAAHLAPAAFRNAGRAEQDARRLHDAGRMTEATARYYEASGLYESAALSANAQRAQASERAAAAPPVQAEPRPAETSKPAETPPAPVIPSVHPEPPPAPPVTPPAPAVVPPPPVAPDLPSKSPTAEDAIGQLLAQYESALEARNFDALKRLWPGLSGPPANAIRNEFQHARRISVDIIDPRISAKDTSGTVTFRRRYELLTIDGQQLSSETPAVMDVRKTPGGWIIDSVRFSAGR